MMLKKNQIFKTMILTTDDQMVMATAKILVIGKEFAVVEISNPLEPKKETLKIIPLKTLRKLLE